MCLILVYHITKKNIVKFIDFSNDGYTRQNRKKSGLDVNLKNTDNAIERYNEIVNLVLYGKNYLEYFSEKEYIEDTISLDGDDWTFSKHIKIDTKPTTEDFKSVIKEYINWKISSSFEEEL